MPSLSASATATSGAKSEGMTTTPWYQGDMIVNWADGELRTGTKTQGAAPGVLGSIPTEALIAVAIVIGALLWKKLS